MPKHLTITDINQSRIDALASAVNPSSANRFITIDEIGSISAAALPSFHTSSQTQVTCNDAGFTTRASGSVALTVSASIFIAADIDSEQGTGGGGAPTGEYRLLVVSGAITHQSIIHTLDFSKINATQEHTSLTYTTPTLAPGIYSASLECRRVSGGRDFFINKYSFSALGLHSGGGSGGGSGSVPTLNQVLNVGNDANQNSINNIGFLEFSERSEPAIPAANKIRIWAEDKGGLTVMKALPSEGRVFQLMRDNWLIGRNQSGTLIPKGTAVYPSGSTGNEITFNRAEPNTLDKLPAIGITVADCPNNSFCRIMLYGRVDNINTSAWNIGDALFVTTNGALTNIEPPPPSFRQRIGIVLIKATNGSIEVDTQAVSEQPITVPTPGAIPRANSSGSLIAWVQNETDPFAIAMAIALG